MTRLILFDVGRVLIDFDFGIAVKKLRGLFELDTSKIQALFKNPSLTGRWDKGLISPEEFFKAVQDEMDFPIGMEGFASIWNGIFTEKKEVISLARSLTKDYKVVLLSNTNPWHAGYLRKNFSWIKDFHDFIASCDVQLLKPDPEIFRLSLAKAQVEPRHTFYVDDLLENVEVAKKLGMDALIFQDALHLKREIQSRVNF